MSYVIRVDASPNAWFTGRKVAFSNSVNDARTFSSEREALLASDDVREDYGYEGSEVCVEPADNSPPKRVATVTLVVTVKGPAEVLAGYAGRVGGEDMANLFYGIGDAGIAEIVSSVILEG